MERLPERLPPGFSFTRLEPVERPGVPRHVAIFRFRDGREFVFLPSFLPSARRSCGLAYETFMRNLVPWQWECLKNYREEYQADPRPYLRRTFSPPRAATIGPLLVERCSRDAKLLGEEQVSPDDPWDCALLQGELPEHEGPRITWEGPQGKYYAQKFDQTARGDFRADWHYDPKSGEIGSLHAVYRLQAVHRHTVNGVVANEGLRLPSEDEWEIFASAGSRGLYYWGNAAREELNRHRWPAHPWGLLISRTSYHFEMVRDNLDLREGGDGGMHVCGGDGLGEWVPLVTAYRGHWPTYRKDGSLGSLAGHVRRVCDVPAPSSKDNPMRRDGSPNEDHNAIA